MKRLTFISFVALSVGAMTQAASAADLAVKAPVRVFSWTGCFVGSNAGGLWTNREWDDGGIFPGDPFVGQPFGSHNGNSWIGGAQIGCDYQFAADGLSASKATTIGPTPPAAASTRSSLPSPTRPTSSRWRRRPGGSATPGTVFSAT
jgi:opacity protein-like surface antigen